MTYKIYTITITTDSEEDRDLILDTLTEMESENTMDAFNVQSEEKEA